MPERPRVARVVEAAAVEARPFLAVPAAGPADDPVAEARARGREDGRAEGRREADAAYEAELAGVRSELSRALERVARLQETLTSRHETTLVEIAIAAASRVARERIESGDPVVVRAVREALEALPRSAVVRVRAHPEDATALEGALAADIGRGRIDIAPDPGVSRGGAVLDSPLGTVDATVEAALEAVRAATLGEAESS